MTLDRALGLLGVIIGLPSFLALFFSDQATAALLCGVIAILMVAAAVWVNKAATDHPFRMDQVVVHLDLSKGPPEATLTKTYKIVPNFNHLTQMVHRNIAADGDVSDFRWNGRPIPNAQQRRTMGGEYEITVPFTPAPSRGKPFDGSLSYKLLNSFPADSESLGYVVDFPTKIVTITVTLPAARKCLTAIPRLAFGGQERDLSALTIGPNRETLSISVKKPRVGSQIITYWTW